MKLDSQSLRYSLFKVYQFSRGRNVNKYLKEFERTQWLPREKLDEIQWDKLKRLLEHAYNNTSYYGHVFKRLKLEPSDIKNPEDFERLPIITKEDIEKNISKMIASNYPKNSIAKNSTGGSTGRNLTFYNDLKRSDIRAAINFRGNKWAGLDIGTKHAYLWGSPFDTSLQNDLKNKIYNKLIGCDLYLSSYKLTKEDMISYSRSLQNYKPDVIIGYPSALYQFVTYLEENKILNITPKSVISSAETLYDYQRDKLQNILHTEVFNRYGCREFGSIAQECHEHIGMHVNQEHIYMELVDKDNNSNEKGRIIITDLDNYAMPFIRYEIEDQGELVGYDCSCGRELPILNVKGRSFDVIIGINGNQLGGTFWTLLFRSLPGIKQFQVIQESKTSLTLKLMINEEFKEDYKKNIIKKIKEYCGKDMEITIDIADEIPLSKSGKRRFIVSNL